MIGEFRDAYDREQTRASATVGAGLKALNRRLAKVDGEIKNLIRAVKAGMDSHSLCEELRTAENIKIELQRRIEAASRPTPSLPHNLEEHFASFVRVLENILGQQEHIVLARDVLKTLINKIVVEENPAGGHVLHIEGDLARALNEETPGNAGRLSTAKSSLGLVAGGRFDLDRTTTMIPAKGIETKN
jgi:site-specific DNA recombinase